MRKWTIASCSRFSSRGWEAPAEPEVRCLTYLSVTTNGSAGVSAHSTFIDKRGTYAGKPWPDRIQDMAGGSDAVAGDERSGRTAAAGPGDCHRRRRGDPAVGA